MAASDYADDLRIGPEILKTFVETYRKMRNTLRWMLGTLAHYDPQRTVAHADMPELERLMLHRLAELDDLVRKAYAEYDYKRVVAALSQFMNTDLSAFYFDIRKDALYCEPYSSAKRRAALETIEQIFRCTCAVAGAVPLLHGRGGLARALSVGERLGAPGGCSRTCPRPGATRRWRRSGRRSSACAASSPGALEIERAAKKIGSSLEAAPQVYISDDELAWRRSKASIFAEVCITSGIEVRRRARRRKRVPAAMTCRASAW